MCARARASTDLHAHVACARADLLNTTHLLLPPTQAESPDATSTALIREVSTGGVEEQRSMAAVLARSAVPEMWEKLSDQSREGIKQQLLVSLEAETSPNMSRKLANVVGAISFAVRDGGWPDLIPAMVAMCTSDVAAKKEMAYHVLAILPQQVGDQIKQHFPQLSVLYEQALVSGDSNVHVSGFRAIASYLSMCDTPKELKPLQVCAHVWVRVRVRVGVCVVRACVYLLNQCATHVRAYAHFCLHCI